VDKKSLIIILVVLVVFLGAISAAYFIGRARANRSGVGASTELYQDTLAEIGKLRGEIATYSELIGQLGPEISELAGRIESITGRVETSLGRIERSLEISGDIESGSGEIRDIAGELRGDIADIGEASRGLAEIFAVDREEP
jgi:methyl-accepting chemotaxis protein